MDPRNNEIAFESSSVPLVRTRSFIGRCVRSWYLFVLFGILAGGASWLYLQYQTPLFEVGGKILVQKDDKSEIVGESLFGVASPFLSDGLSMVNEVEILQSRSLMQKVVEDLDLDIRYFSEGRFINYELYPPLAIEIEFPQSHAAFYGTTLLVTDMQNNEYQLDVNEWSVDEGDFVVTETLNGVYGQENNWKGEKFTLIKNEEFADNVIIQVDDLRSRANRFIGRLSLEPIPQSEVITITLRDNIPARSVAVINKLIEVYNEDVIENKNRSINKTITFIDDRLEFITKELFDVENELEDFKRANEVPLELSQTAQLFLEEVSDSDKAIGELELQESVLRAIETELLKQRAEYELLSVNLVVAGQQPLAVQDYNRLVMERNNLLVSATLENPAVKAVERQLVQVRASLLNWVDFKKGEIAGQINFLKKKSNPINQRIQQIPKYEREMLQIMRQQVIKETLFTFLLQRREEASLAIASEVSNARVINDPAIGSKISPNKRIIYLAGIILGLGFPTLFLFLREYFDRNIYSKSDVMELTQAPFLGEIADAGKATDIVVTKSSRSVIAEMFRLLRSNLSFIFEAEKNSVILVTSSTSGEGKTFMSINLAASLAISGKSVVVLGMDLRKPKLATYLKGNDGGIGITNFLIGQIEHLDDVIRKVDENYYYMPSGPVPPNPNELILGQRTTKLFEKLKERFDYIIVDTPPVGLVADAFSLKEHVDITLYVAKFGYSKRDQLDIVQDIYLNKKLPNPAIVLNGMKKRIGQAYGRYRSYSYSYGQGYGYYSDGDEGWIKRMKKKIFKS